MDTLRGIFKFIKKLNEEWGSLFTAFLSFLGTAIYVVFINFFLRRVYDGYLMRFGIDSSITISSPMSNLYVLFFIFGTALSLITFFTPMRLSKALGLSVQNKEEKISKKLVCKFFILDFLLIFIPTLIYLSYSTNIKNSSLFIWGIVYMAGTAFFSFMISVVSTIYIVADLIFQKKSRNNDTSKNSKTSNDFLSILSSKSVKHIILSVFLLVILSIFDYAAVFYGKMVPSLKKAYPSFTVNQVEYIVIAEMPDNEYLIVDLESMANETKYTIQSLEGIYLKDKLTSDFLKYLSD